MNVPDAPERTTAAVLSGSSAVPSTAPPPASTAATAYKPPFGPLFWFAVAWLGLVVAVAAFGRFLPIPAADEYSGDTSFFLSKRHWLGTDTRGRDVLARLAEGSRISLLIALTTGAVGWLIGGTLGLLSGFLRGRFDALVQYFLNLILAFPAILLALLVVTVRGPAVSTVVTALAVLAIPAIARVVRASTLAYSQREFVTAAHTSGASKRRVMVRELLPNVLPAMMTYGLVQMSIVIIAEGALTYTGNGVPPGTVSWGGMVVTGQPDIESHPHITLIPAAVICLTAYSLNLIGDRLRDRTDVRQSNL
jgi:peptide/nickel transport system permease protein